MAKAIKARSTIQNNWVHRKTRIRIDGQTFGRLTVVELLGYRQGSTKSYWLCKCECGNTCEATIDKLRAGDVKSCGCYRSEKRTTHGQRTSPEYNSWFAMRQRCNNPNTKVFYRYGGRGITVCEAWNVSFAAFMEDMGPKPSPQHSIERVDNNGMYCKENCRWATSSEQCSNTRRNRMLTVDGQTMTIAEWARKTGIHFCTITNRLNSGWSDVDCVRVKPHGKRVR